MSEEQEQAKTDLEMLQRHCEQLTEHFDSVQIFCTRYNPGEGTVSVKFGLGNWYTRFGQVKEWIVQEEQTRVNERKENGE